MVNSLDFTKRLEKILAYYGLTATAFSEEIDFNRSTISHLLSGRNKPSLEFVMKVVKHFPEVELYWLLNGKGSFPASEEIEKPSALKLDTQPAIPVPSNSKTEISPPETVKTNNKDIERIIIFYKDGSFKEYRS